MYTQLHAHPTSGHVHPSSWRCGHSCSVCAHTYPTTWQESLRRSCMWVPMCCPIPSPHQLGVDSLQRPTGGCWVWPGQCRDSDRAVSNQASNQLLLWFPRWALSPHHKCSSLFLFELTSPLFKKKPNLFVFSWLIFNPPDNQLPLERYQFWAVLGVPITCHKYKPSCLNSHCYPGYFVKGRP